MGRYIEQGIYEKRGIWIGKETNSPRRTNHEVIDNGKAFSPKILLQPAVKNFSVNHWLSTGSLMNLLPFMERVSFRGGEHLYHSGEKIDYVYFPETTVISEFQYLEDGRTIEIAMTGKEGIIGFLPIFSANANINWTQISMPGNALRISSQVFEQEILKKPVMQIALFDYVSSYVGQISQRSVCNSYHSIEQRFCSWLLMLQNRKESERLPLTQEQIARSLGAHRPSVTHTAQNLRDRGVIDYVRGKIFINDRSLLEDAACDCHLEIDKTFSAKFESFSKPERKYRYS